MLLTDISAIIIKEWKEIFAMRGNNKRSGWVSVFITVGLLGIYMPLMSGEDWLTNPVVPFTWAWLPVFQTLSIITNAIAGERERHTLETLLASRLSDKAILYGKILSSVLYSWLLMAASLLLGAITINVVQFNGSIQFYSPGSFFGGLLLIFLVAALFSCLGALVSLRAPTARQAYQKMSIAMLLIWVAPFLVLQFLPEDILNNLENQLEAFDLGILPYVFFGITSILILAITILFLIIKGKFKRNILILD
ncbi:MAG: ABC transporter permease [Anaerolineales bacterium]|nr:ABC transporter permease [Anaerolineales bacterium]